MDAEQNCGFEAFGFPEFLRIKMINGMKGELESYHVLIQSLFDWDSVPGADVFNKQLKKLNDKNQQDNTWEGDPKEVARRVWQWWVANHHHFHYLSIAVRLIVLVQTSSASALNWETSLIRLALLAWMILWSCVCSNA